MRCFPLKHITINKSRKTKATYNILSLLKFTSQSLKQELRLYLRTTNVTHTDILPDVFSSITTVPQTLVLQQAEQLVMLTIGMNHPSIETMLYTSYKQIVHYLTAVEREVCTLNALEIHVYSTCK